MIKKILALSLLLMSFNAFGEIQRFITRNAACELLNIHFIKQPAPTIRYGVNRGATVQKSTNHKEGIFLERVEMSFGSRYYTCNVNKVFKKGNINVFINTCSIRNLCDYIKLNEHP